MSILKTILVIEDQSQETEQLRSILGSRYRVLSAASGNDALRLFKQEAVQTVLLDIVLGDMDGLNVLRILRKLDEQVPVIMMSSITKINTVVESIKLGATDYISKPINTDELLHAVERALQETQRAKELESLKERIEADHRFEDIVGESPAIRQILSQIDRLKGSQTSVLITGESGTGKEMVARAIHKATCAPSAPYLAINCGAIPAELFESELFGHESGSFTGAVGRRIGKVELAQDGTLFLDELGTLPLQLQVKLLRVLQERTLTRVGGSKQIPISFRLVSATNSDLEKEVAAGRFREDLYYRINVIHLHVPPLRERQGDVTLLAHYFLKKHTGASRQATLAPDALERLSEYAWKGNVRELENVIERALILCSGDTITAQDLPLGPATPQGRAAPAPGGIPASTHSSSGPAHPSPENGFSLHEYLESLERKYIEDALVRTDGHREKAAKLLGIHRNTLSRRLAHFRISAGGRE